MASRDGNTTTPITITMVCAMPIRPGQTGHPHSGQTLAVHQLFPRAGNAGHRADGVGRGLPGATVRARIPSVARSALSGITGKMAASFQACSAPDQS
jgi:hypothetical protein